MTRYRTLLVDSARWDGFEFRPGDIVISTPAKCGTTWTQMICALLIFQDVDLPQPLTELSPWIDVQTEPIVDVLAKYAAQEHRRFIKTHTPFDGLPRDDRATYICVGRDPRDVAISWDNHRDNLNLEVVVQARIDAVGLDDLRDLLPDGPPPSPPDDPMERFWQWVDDDEPAEDSMSSLKLMLHHIDSFWSEHDDPDVVMLHYSDLKHDLEGEMRNLAARLGIAVDAAAWPALVDAATFDRMREKARTLAPQTSIDGFWSDPNRFFRAGVSRQWEAMLDGEGLARYERRVAALASPDLATWVHRD